MIVRDIIKKNRLQNEPLLHELIDFMMDNIGTCVRDHSSELIERLRYVLNSREDFDRIKHIISEKAEIGDVKRAAEFYQLIRYS